MGNLKNDVNSKKMHKKDKQKTYKKGCKNKD